MPHPLDDEITLSLRDFYTLMQGAVELAFTMSEDYDLQNPHPEQGFQTVHYSYEDEQFTTTIIHAELGMQQINAYPIKIKNYA